MILKLATKISRYDIYRKNFFNKESETRGFIKCDNSSSYLKYLNKYYSKAFEFQETIFSISDDPTFQKFFYWSAQHELNQPEQEGFYKSFLQFRNQKLKLQIIGDDDYFVGKFTKALRSYYGGVHPFDCSDGDYDIKKGKRGLIFYSVNKLSKAKRSQLITEIIDDEYKNKPVFFVTTEPFDVPHLPRLKKAYLPSVGEIRDYFPQFFFTIIMEKEILLNHNDIQFFRNIYAHLLNGELLKDIFNSAKSLTELDQLLEKLLLDKSIEIDLLHQDFWYQFIQHFESGEIKLDVLKKAPTIDEDTNILDEENIELIELIFQHTEDEGEEFWIVTSNLFDGPKQISYNKSLGIKIMAYLKKFPSCKKLTSTVLRKKIKSYYGKEYKSQRKKVNGPVDKHKNAFNAMRGAVKYDLEEKIFKGMKKKNEISGRVLKCFMFSKYCYYKEKEKKNVSLNFHDPHLEDYDPHKD